MTESDDAISDHDGHEIRIMVGGAVVAMIDGRDRDSAARLAKKYTRMESSSFISVEERDTETGEFRAAPDLTPKPAEKKGASKSDAAAEPKDDMMEIDVMPDSKA